MTAIAVDDGYRQIKVAWFDAQQQINTRVFPSVARAGMHGVTGFGGAPVAGYESEGQRFTVGPEMDGENTRFDGYPTSALNRILVHHALAECGFGGQSVRIATGLPVADYYQHPERVNAKMASLMLPVQALDGRSLARITDQRVYAEAASAWVDAAMDNAGQIQMDLNAPVAVVDVGGRTTDVVIMLSGMRIDQDRSGTDEIGVLDLLDHLRLALSAQFQIPATLSDAEQALRHGKLHLYGRPVDVADLVDKAREQVTGSLLRAVHRRIEKVAHQLETVLFVGGGAAALADLLASYPNAVVPMDPQCANVRGFLKYLVHVDGDGQ